MGKEYVFKIDSNDIDSKKLNEIKELFDLNEIKYRFEELEPNIEEINCIKPILFYYTNGYIDNCVGFNNIVDIDRFIEVYPTITPMYSFNVVGGFTLLNNYVGKELTDEIISYCKKVYHDKSK